MTFSVPIQEFSTFLFRKRDITSRRPFSFHDAKKISYVLFCDNCTALTVYFASDHKKVVHRDSAVSWK